MREQGRKLMAMIGMAVSSLDRLETIIPAVVDLGQRHTSYGVQPAHYDTVGAVLLDLESRAGGCVHASRGGCLEGGLHDPRQRDERPPGRRRSIGMKLHRLEDCLPSNRRSCG
jgi:Globin